MEYRKMDSHSAYPDAPFLWHKMPVFKSASPRFAVSFQSAVLVLIAQVWTESQDHRLGVSSKIAQATGGLGNRTPDHLSVFGRIYITLCPEYAQRPQCMGSTWTRLGALMTGPSNVARRQPPCASSPGTVLVQCAHYATACGSPE